MLMTVSCCAAICQSVAAVQLASLAPLGALSHRFNFLIIYMEPRAATKKRYASLAMPKATCLEFQVSHVCRLIMRVKIRWYRGLCRNSPHGWGNHRKISARRQFGEGSATSHFLNWGPLPQNEVCRIARTVKEGERMEKVENRDGLNMNLRISNT